MKSFLISLNLIFGILGISEISAEPDVKAELNLGEDLLYYIAESKGIYYMSDVNIWTVIAGNKDVARQPVKAFRDLISEGQKLDEFFFPDESFEKKMEEAGNFYLAFTGKNAACRFFVMNKYKATMQNWLEKGKRVEAFPQDTLVSNDLIRLCKLRWVIRKLSKGELVTDDYRFSSREWSAVMKLSPDHWGEHLVKYAISDVTPVWRLAEDDYLRVLIDSLDLNKELLDKYPYLEGVDTNTKFFSGLVMNNKGHMADFLTLRYESLLSELKAVVKLSKENHFFVKIILADEKLNKKKLNGYGDLKLIRKYIIKHKDMELLKSYMQRIKHRQSVADIPVLGEFLQSDLYMKGTEDYRHVILDQCALRKEKEVVWLLANSVGFPKPEKDRPLEKILRGVAKFRAKEIMIKFTKEDLGNDPKAWKKWYRDQ